MAKSQDFLIINNNNKTPYKCLKIKIIGINMMKRGKFSIMSKSHFTDVQYVSHVLEFSPVSCNDTFISEILYIFRRFEGDAFAVCC